MRLTRAGEYAIRCMLYLCRRGKGVLTPRREIAEAMDIPLPFLGKIAQQLARSGLIEISQGAKGGYRLRLPPEEVTLLDVVETAMGEIFLNDCVINPDTCRRKPECAVHQVWQKARDGLREVLRQAKFSELLREESCILPSAGASETPSPRRGQTP